MACAFVVFARLAPLIAAARAVQPTAPAAPAIFRRPAASEPHEGDALFELSGRDAGGHGANEQQGGRRHQQKAGDHRGNEQQVGVRHQQEAGDHGGNDQQGGGRHQQKGDDQGANELQGSGNQKKNQTANNKTTNSVKRVVRRKLAPVNLSMIPAQYRRSVRSPDIFGPGTPELRRRLNAATANGTTLFETFYGTHLSDCARSTRLRSFRSRRIMDLSVPGCYNGRVTDDGEGLGSLPGSMTICEHPSGAPRIVVYDQPGCKAGTEWNRRLTITAAQWEGILDRYCIEIWAGGFFNTDLLNYKLSTGNVTPCQ